MLQTVEERCVYRPSPDNSDWTEVQREAWISSRLFGFSYALQTFGFERFKKNAKRSLKGFNYTLARLFTPAGAAAEPDQAALFHANAEKLKSKAKAATGLAATMVARN